MPVQEVHFRLKRVNRIQSKTKYSNSKSNNDRTELEWNSYYVKFCYFICECLAVSGMSVSAQKGTMSIRVHNTHTFTYIYKYRLIVKLVCWCVHVCGIQNEFVPIDPA